MGRVAVPHQLPQAGLILEALGPQADHRLAHALLNETAAHSEHLFGR